MEPHVDVDGDGIDDRIESKRHAVKLANDARKWTVRRRMAIGSFAALIVFGVYYALIGLFVSQDIAKTMSEFNSIVVTIIGALASLLLGYYGTTYLDDKSKRREQDYSDSYHGSQYNNDKHYQ